MLAAHPGKGPCECACFCPPHRNLAEIDQERDSAFITRLIAPGNLLFDFLPGSLAALNEMSKMIFSCSRAIRLPALTIRRGLFCRSTLALRGNEAGRLASLARGTTSLTSLDARSEETRRKRRSSAPR